MSGKLNLIPTPIGNLEDITYRAVRLLKEADYILAEDSRQTMKLSAHYEIDNKIVPFHRHNEHKMLKRVIGDLHSGMHIAQVSDAGTPGISDPGFLLARECRREGIPFETLPGATALIPALVNSGLPCDRFVFEGFLPHKKGRQTRLKAIAAEERTAVLFESPHRVLKLLKELLEYAGEERLISVSRELTKIYEETRTAPIDEMIDHFEQNPPRGEFVVVLEGTK